MATVNRIVNLCITETMDLVMIDSDALFTDAVLVEAFRA